MTESLPTLATTSRGPRSPWALLLTALVLLVFAMQSIAQAPAAPTAAAPPPAADSMDNLVGRIALYPDDLVAIILPASTNPLQIVQADRWLEKRKADPKLPMDDKWDDAVKTLLNYPEVVKMMSDDLDWTSALGEAVVADQGAVLEGVQNFRRRAQAAGNLKSDDKQVVKAEQETIIIEPANPEVIYVPQYTPSTVVTVGVAPIYGYYPAPYPSYYYPYPPGAALAAGVIWGAAIGAAWNGGHWGANYGGNTINVNRNTNINTGNVNRGSAGQQPAGGSAWKSNKQPGQVSSSVGKTPNTARAGDARGGAAAGNYGSAGAGGARASTQQAGGGAGGGARPSTQPGGAAAGGGAARPSTQPSGGGSANRGGDALGGYSSGRQTQANSSRGASSRSSMSGGGSRPAPSGGARGGGGGRR
jgi:hypothetical protein